MLKQILKKRALKLLLLIAGYTVLSFAVYDLSMGPVFLLCLKGGISHPTFKTIYAPIFNLEKQIPLLYAFNEEYMVYWYDKSVDPHPRLFK